MTTAAVARIPRFLSRSCIFILLAGLIIRLGWALYQPVDNESLAALPDQVEYLSLARNLLQNGSLSFYDERFRQVVYAYRMPGYPAFLAACLANARAARVVQALLDSSTILATGILVRLLFSRHTAARATFTAMMIVAFNPFLIFFSGLLLSETLFTAMLAWGMVLLLTGARGGRFSPEPDGDGDVEESAPAVPNERRWWGTAIWLAGGLMIAMSSLVRPSAPPLTVILGLLASFAARPRDRSHPAFRPAWPLPVGTTMLLLTGLILVPWASRNSHVVDAWVWTTTNGGVTAYDGFNPDATGASDQSGLRSMPQLQRMNEVDRSTYLAEQASRWIRENPWRAIQLAATKAGRTWSPIPLSDEYGNWKLIVVGLMYCVPLFALAAAGLFRGGLTRSQKGFLIAPALYFTVVHMASVGSLRYRVPVEPELAVLAAAGVGAIRFPVMKFRRAGVEDAES